jgi:hypothetical protein
LRLESRLLNALVELRAGGWERELFKQSKGDRPLGDLLEKVPTGVAWETVREELFLFYQLAVLNFYATTPVGLKLD